MMHVKKNTWLLLFTLGGALVGLGYYYVSGCGTGSCAITANIGRSVAYMALLGWLLSNVFRKEGGCKCNM